MLTPLDKTLEVEVVERRLAELWQQTSGNVGLDDEFAVLRARVANLLVYVSSDSILGEVNGILDELTAIHPSRVLLMLGEQNASDHDIEMSVETLNVTDKRSGATRLCCEEVMLKAAGSFVSELPSAALPLLVPDLTTFLWWRAAVETDNEVFDALLQASDRLVVDSAEFVDPATELLGITRLFTQEDYSHVGISDLNWARLTSWRDLLAGFYDVAAYQPLLANVERVRIDYLPPEHAPTAIAPQALLVTGWLASRLGWSFADDQPFQQDGKVIFNRPLKPAEQGNQAKEGKQTVVIELNRVERSEGKPGRLVRVELQSNTAHQTSFAVSRSDDNLHLTTEANLNAEVHRGRVVPVRNRSAARLLSREMEILCNDRIYQEALAVSATLIEGTVPSSDG